jgi:hypothetical protein
VGRGAGCGGIECQRAKFPFSITEGNFQKCKVRKTNVYMFLINMKMYTERNNQELKVFAFEEHKSVAGSTGEAQCRRLEVCHKPCESDF